MQLFCYHCLSLKWKDSFLCPSKGWEQDLLVAPNGFPSILLFHAEDKTLVCVRSKGFLLAVKGFGRKMLSLFVLSSYSADSAWSYFMALLA